MLKNKYDRILDKLFYVWIILVIPFAVLALDILYEKFQDENILKMYSVLSKEKPIEFLL